MAFEPAFTRATGVRLYWSPRNNEWRVTVHTFVWDGVKSHNFKDQEHKALWGDAQAVVKDIVQGYAIQYSAPAQGF